MQPKIHQQHNFEADTLKLHKIKSIMKAIGKERIQMSTKIFKFNKKNKKQQRSFLITDKAMYNISQGFMSTDIKRRIAFIDIAGITVSNISNEFVVHVPKEYDYRFASPKSRDAILEIIMQNYAKLADPEVQSQHLAFWTVENHQLINFSTTKEDKSLGITRIPQSMPTYYDVEDRSSMEAFEECFNDDEGENAVFSMRISMDKKEQLQGTIFTKDEDKSKKIGIDDFKLIKVLGRGAFGKVMLVQKKDTKEFFALKSIRKDEIIDKEQIEHIKTEYSLCGTPEYLAPEVLNGEGHGLPSDWWALGVLIYEMIIGIPPFYHQNQQKMFEMIQDEDIKFPTQIEMSDEGVDIVLRLLDKNPKSRLGSGSTGIDDIKNHAWFKGSIDWHLLKEKKLKAPYEPKTEETKNYEFFDTEFTQEEVINSQVPQSRIQMVEDYQDEFEGFTYVKRSGLNQK